MLDHAETAPGAPAFVDWVNARAHVLQRFCYLTTGDVQVAGAVLEQVLASLHLQWRELADLGDLEIVVRQEILRVQASRRYRATGPPTDRDPGPPGVEEQLRQAWRIYRGMALEARAAVVLRYAEQMDVLDVAEVLDREQDAVRDLLGSALAAVSSRTRVSPASPRPDGPVDPESMLRETFHDYASRAPVVDDLAGRVVGVTRRRRRRQATVGVLAVLVLLVPVAWLASPEKPPQAASWAPTPVPGVPLAAVPGMRWESYGGIQLQVPEDWGYGDLTQWCVPEDQPGGVDGPAVDRPGTGTTAVCTANSSTGTRGVQRPTYTAGLLLRPAGDGPRIGRADVAEGAPVYRRRFAGVDLTVIDVDRALAEQILTSAVPVYRTDVNGCEPHVDVPPMGRLLSLSSIGIDGVADTLRHTDAEPSMSICHYESRPWGRPTLVFSERLGPAGAARMVAALETAGQTTARLPRDVPERCLESETALLRFSTGAVPTDAWVHYSGCGPFGVDDGVAPRQLSEEVLRPVLDPPWRSAVGAEVPWPRGPAAEAGQAGEAGPAGAPE